MKQDKEPRPADWKQRLLIAAVTLKLAHDGVAIVSTPTPKKATK